MRFDGVRERGRPRSATPLAIAAFHRCKSTRASGLASKDYEVAEERGGQESKRETLRADEGHTRNALSQFSFFANPPNGDPTAEYSRTVGGVEANRTLIDSKRQTEQVEQGISV